MRLPRRPFRRLWCAVAGHEHRSTCIEDAPNGFETVAVCERCAATFWVPSEWVPLEGDR